MVLFKNSFCFHSQPHLVILQVSTTECNITWRRMKPAILPSACLIVFYLIVEVTGFSQTVNGEKTLPHSTSQAWRYTHPDKSLNLKTQQGWKGRQDVCLNLLHGKTIWKIISKTLLGFFLFFLCSWDQSHLALADKAGSVPVAEQLTQLFHPHRAHFGVADTQHNIVGLDWFISFWKSGWWWRFQWKQNWSLSFALLIYRGTIINDFWNSELFCHCWYLIQYSLSIREWDFACACVFKSRVIAETIPVCWVCV